MQKNTIKHLNTKIWYRLLKVFYIGIFLLSTIGIATNVYFESNRINEEETIIQCANGQNYNAYEYELLINKVDVKTNNEAYIFCNESTIQNYLNDNAIDVSKRENIVNGLNAGDLSESDVLSSIKKTYGYKYSHPLKRGLKPLEVILNNLTYNSLGENIINHNPENKIKIELRPHNSMLKTFCLIFIYCIVNLLIFEGIRRVFYYIILGKIAPKE